MTNIVIVDDHKLFRITLRMALSNTPDLCVSGEADSGASLFNLLHITPCHLVLLDIGLPDMNGVEVARLLRLNHPSLKILAISAENSSDTIRNLFEIGIDGFVSKQVGEVTEIIHAIQTIMSGETYYGKDISTMIYQIYVSKKNSVSALPEFTLREKEIVELCRKGLIAKEIADQLHISVNTVHNHKNNIFRKLGIGNTMEMVDYALKHKIIRP